MEKYHLTLLCLGQGREETDKDRRRGVEGDYDTRDRVVTRETESKMRCLYRIGDDFHTDRDDPPDTSKVTPFRSRHTIHGRYTVPTSETLSTDPASACLVSGMGELESVHLSGCTQFMALWMACDTRRCLLTFSLSTSFRLRWHPLFPIKVLSPLRTSNGRSFSLL